jgi:hypothetical protein
MTGFSNNFMEMIPFPSIGDVVINEFVASPNPESVELYNTRNKV